MREIHRVFSGFGLGAGWRRAGPDIGLIARIGRGSIRTVVFGRLLGLKALEFMVSHERRMESTRRCKGEASISFRVAINQVLAKDRSLMRKHFRGRVQGNSGLAIRNAADSFLAALFR